MKLPNQRKILREDLKDAPGWVSNLINPINSFMESIYQAVNKNLTFQDNFAAQVKELDVKTTASYPTMDVIKVQSTLATRAIGVTVLQCYEKASYVPPAGTVTVNWVEVDGVINIQNVTGLDASKAYLVRLLII